MNKNFKYSAVGSALLRAAKDAPVTDASNKIFRSAHAQVRTARKERRAGRLQFAGDGLRFIP